MKVERGSGNVFADLGLPDAVELKAKVQLAVAIARKIDARGWSQKEAAKSLAIDPSFVAALLRYRLDEFSVEQLKDIHNRV